MIIQAHLRQVRTEGEVGSPSTCSRTAHVLAGNSEGYSSTVDAWLYPANHSALLGQMSLMAEEPESVAQTEADALAAADVVDITQALLHCAYRTSNYGDGSGPGERTAAEVPPGITPRKSASNPRSSPRPRPSWG